MRLEDVIADYTKEIVDLVDLNMRSVSVWEDIVRKRDELIHTLKANKFI